MRNCLLAEYRAQELTSAFVQLDSIISHCSGKKPELLPSKSTFSGRNVDRSRESGKNRAYCSICRTQTSSLWNGWFV